MTIKAKAYILEEKTTAQQKLANRIALLESKGEQAAAVTRDTIVKKLKADVRKANRRLAAVAAREQLIAGKAEAKAEKAVAKKEKKAAGASKGRKKEEPQPAAKAGKKAKKAAK
ncbi:hypothetical protein [Desulfatitalea alkaliphila]|uniref:Uncharacterized protein n=1 Tax=Desulfatitalea alkaliphila TaxID=2929485 RepID=A0AA41UK38_9BACT|nr:hypothetical protein [Desulfatitalea alkaliphila]MCJ8501899.1 hypothetical protein [Desulfatitalea alkaliphila]